MRKYHDSEWGRPLHDDRKLFEFLILDAAQAGLSWRTVLHKRKNYKKAFDNFDPVKISQYKAKDLKRLMVDSGIIRNKLKIESAIHNAKAYILVKKEFGSFDKYIWQFTNYETIDYKPKKESQIKARSGESDKMSEDMRKRGFKFVGSTICYAFMQAAGMVNDHLVTCETRRKLSN